MNVKIVCFLLGRLTLYGAGTSYLPFIATPFLWRCRESFLWRFYHVDRHLGLPASGIWFL